MRTHSNYTTIVLNDKDYQDLINLYKETESDIVKEILQRYERSLHCQTLLNDSSISDFPKIEKADWSILENMNFTD